jgi:hypothetical protein
LSRKHLAWLVNTLPKYDLNEDGKIHYVEWITFQKSIYKPPFNSHPRMGNTVKKIFPLPYYSCTPPKLFILVLTCVQIFIFMTK